MEFCLAYVPKLKLQQIILISYCTYKLRRTERSKGKTQDFKTRYAPLDRTFRRIVSNSMEPRWDRYYHEYYPHLTHLFSLLRVLVSILLENAKWLGSDDVLCGVVVGCRGPSGSEAGWVVLSGERGRHSSRYHIFCHSICHNQSRNNIESQLTSGSTLLQIQSWPRNPHLIEQRVV